MRAASETGSSGEEMLQRGSKDSHRSNPDPGSSRWRAPWCAAGGKELDNDHAAATARAWRAMIDRGVRIGRILCHRLLGLRHWYGDQFLGADDVGLAAGAGEQPAVAERWNPLGRTWSRKRLMNSSAPSVTVRYRACPLRR